MKFSNKKTLKKLRKNLRKNLRKIKKTFKNGGGKKKRREKNKKTKKNNNRPTIELHNLSDLKIKEKQAENTNAPMPTKKKTPKLKNLLSELKEKQAENINAPPSAPMPLMPNLPPQAAAAENKPISITNKILLGFFAKNKNIKDAKHIESNIFSSVCAPISIKKVASVSIK